MASSTIKMGEIIYVDYELLVEDIIQSGGTLDKNKNVSLDGYTAIGIVTVWGSGTYGSQCLIQSRLLNNNRLAIFRIKNLGDGPTSDTTKINFSVIYRKD